MTGKCGESLGAEPETLLEIGLAPAEHDLMVPHEYWPQERGYGALPGSDQLDEPFVPDVAAVALGRDRPTADAVEFAAGPRFDEMLWFDPGHFHVECNVVGQRRRPGETADRADAV